MVEWLEHRALTVMRVVAIAFLFSRFLDLGQRMQSIKKEHRKKVWGCFVFVFGVTIIIVAGLKNPSKADSEARLAVMTADMHNAR
ncbi:hypothetical protein BG57_05815 [Caballeronia grimmiae]|uniref:Uncharacterized protein n=1 Tax=Caballeronia grimmiae TaxID=1071679 RepID=A0A069P1Q5_9BURK|nr:hypothetical protein BG57_05815 [Caballeronia grimmiae]